jgi:hypothetical protein
VSADDETRPARAPERPSRARAEDTAGHVALEPRTSPELASDPLLGAASDDGARVPMHSSMPPPLVPVGPKEPALAHGRASPPESLGSPRRPAPRDRVRGAPAPHVEPHRHEPRRGLLRRGGGVATPRWWDSLLLDRRSPDALDRKPPSTATWDGTNHEHPSLPKSPLRASRTWLRSSAWHLFPDGLGGLPVPRHGASRRSPAVGPLSLRGPRVLPATRQASSPRARTPSSPPSSITRTSTASTRPSCRC